MASTIIKSNNYESEKAPQRLLLLGRTMSQRGPSVRTSEYVNSTTKDLKGSTKAATSLGVLFRCMYTHMAMDPNHKYKSLNTTLHRQLSAHCPFSRIINSKVRRVFYPLTRIPNSSSSVLERRNSNSRVAFDHQIVIIIIKSRKKINKKISKKQIKSKRLTILPI